MTNKSLFGSHCLKKSQTSGTWWLKIFIFITLFSFVIHTDIIGAPQQSVKITIKMKDVPVKEILKEIEKQSNYFFMYDSRNIQSDRKVTINAVNKSLFEILTQLFSGTDVSFVFEGKHIVLSKSNRETRTAENGSSKNISGVVKDEAGMPIIGATISLIGTSNGSVTDINGSFTLNGIAENSTIHIAYLGYVPQECKIHNQNILSIILKEDSKSLEEVVVVGYGTAQRKNVIGAIDQVNSKAIQDRPVANMTQALQGASPNLVIQTTSFNPNNNAMNINIRGVSTINDNSPLIVVDGLISDSGGLNDLNPADIESVSVLKDAGSAAIYGSRSANGVILITTKTGKKNMKPLVHFTSLIGAQVPGVLIKPVSGAQNALLYDQALINGGASPIYSAAQIRNFATGDSEWFLNQILKTAIQQNYNVSITGGTQSSTYMVSGGLYNQRSNYVGPNYGVSRYNFRTNLTNELGRLKLTTIMNYARNASLNHTGDDGFLIADAERVPVYNTYKMTDASGRYYVNDILTESNPLGTLQQGGTITSDNDFFNGSANAEFKLIEGLKLKGTFGADLRSNHTYTRMLQVPYYSNPDAITPSSYENITRTTEDYNGKSSFLNTQFIIDFDRTFKKVHHVTALAGYSNESYRLQQNDVQMQYTDPQLGTPTTGTVITSASYNTPSGTTERSLDSYFGRLGYSYKNKYYSEFNVRYDGSSKFAAPNRWGLFPSISAGWRISEENFMSFYKEKVGDFKLRASYGILGNQNVNDYQYLTTYTMYNNIYGFNNTSVSGTGFTFGNTQLQWEKTNTLNIGADATFIDNKIMVSYDYFNKLTSGILLTPTVPGTFGGALPSSNSGEMRDQGWEVSLKYRFTTKGGFQHNIGLNVADSWNKVVQLTGGQQITTSDNITRILRVGLPINSYYGYKTDGLFQNYDQIKNAALPIGATVVPGDLIFKDRSGDGIINGNDRYVLGNAFPRYTFGLTYSISWKGFDFNALIQGVGKRDMALRGELIEPFHQNYSYVIYTHQLDFWTPANPDARWPRLSSPGSASNVYNFSNMSSLYVLNAAYVRLKNIQAGYTFPKNISSSIGAQKLRVYITAQNVFTLCANSFIDPESSEFNSNMTSSGANSGRNYPSLKYYGFGIDAEF